MGTKVKVIESRDANGNKTLTINPAGQEPHPPMRRPSLRTAVLWLASGLCAVLVLVTGATNLVLRSDWLSGQLNEDPAALFVAYSGARSFLPGTLRFESLSLRSRDQNIEWEARLEGVTVRVRLMDLAKRRFHATSVSSERLSFRLRERLEPQLATPVRLARYPQIAGFPEPPLSGPASSEGPAHPWRIVVDDLVSRTVDEIWVDSWHWKGTARLEGGFDLLPGRLAEVFPSELSVAAGRLVYGTNEVVRDTRGAVRAALPRFDTQEYPGNEVWKLMSGTAALRGEIRNLEFLSADGEGLRFAGGAGRARLGVVLEDGRGRVRVDADSRGVVVRAGKKVVRGSARVALRARPLDFRAGTAAFDGTSLDLSSVSLDGVPGDSWEGSFTAPRGVLSLKDASLDMEVASRLRDGRPLLSILPPGPPKWLAGLLDLRNFAAAGHVAVSPGRVTISRASAEAGTFHVAADYRKKGSRGWGALLIRKGALSLGLGLQDGGTALHLVGATAWFEGEGRPGGLRTDQPRDSDSTATRRSK